jgi:hypothetical protein
MLDEITNRATEIGGRFVIALDSYADRISDIGVKAGVITGTTTTGTAVASKLGMLSANDVALYVGAISTMIMTVGSLWLSYWHKRRMQQLRLAEIESNRDKGED